VFVYLITNLINGKRYVGQTSKSLEHRFKGHCANESGCWLLNQAIQKYGANNFSIEPIIEVDTKILANEFEIELIIRYCSKAPNGYNLTDGGDGCFNPSLETREKLSKWQKGRKFTLEHRQKLSEAAKRHRSSEGVREQMSKRQILRMSNQDNRNALSETLKIVMNRPETLEKLSKASKGRKLSDDHKQKLKKINQETNAVSRLQNISPEKRNMTQRKILHIRWHVNRNIINPNCKFCKEFEGIKPVE
jgi:group I intron endonuclease